MNLDPASVDRIVQEVVKRLAAYAALPDAASSTGETSGGSLADSDANGGVLRLRERTIAWKGLEDRLSGVKVVEVAPNAVVTPLVRDLLRERRIRLEVVPVGAAVESKQRDASVPALWIGCDRETLESHPHHVRALAGDVEREFLAGKTLLDQSFAALTQTFASKAAGKTLRLWFTDRLAEAVCETNRFAHVRATWGNDPVEASRNVAALRPNVLVLPPTRFSSWQVRQVVAAWLGSPALA